MPIDARHGPVALLLGAVFANCMRRAAVQSIAIDEAITWINWAHGPWAGVFRAWFANNHVLNTILVKAATSIFGSSELVIRLPTLLGAAVYLWALGRLAVTRVGGAAGLALVALGALNPFVADWLVAARGYGLALGALATATLLTMRIVTTRPTSVASLTVLGVVSGLGVSANLGFAPAFLALGLAMAVRLVVDRATEKRWRMLVLMTIPALPAAAIVLRLYLPVLGPRQWHELRTGDGVYGATSLAVTRADLVDRSLIGGLGELVGDSVRHGLLAVLDVACGILLPLAVVGVGIGALLAACRRGRGNSGNTVELAALVGPALLGTLAMHLGMHWAVGTLLPLGRTALPLVFFASVAVVAAVGAIDGRWRRWRTTARWPLAALVLGMVAAAATTRTDGFHDWMYDRRSRQVFEWLDAEHRQRGAPRLRLLCAPFFLRPALEFYRARDGADWLEIDAIGGLDEAGDKLAAPADVGVFFLAPDQLERALRDGRFAIARDAPADGPVVARRR